MRVMNERISQGSPRATFPLLSFLSFLLSLCPHSGWICSSQDKVLRVAHTTKRDYLLGDSRWVWYLTEAKAHVKLSQTQGWRWTLRQTQGRKKGWGKQCSPFCLQGIPLFTPPTQMFYPAISVVITWRAFSAHLICHISGKAVWNNASYLGNDFKPFRILYPVKYYLEYEQNRHRKRSAKFRKFIILCTLWKMTYSGELQNESKNEDEMGYKKQ